MRYREKFLAGLCVFLFGLLNLLSYLRIVPLSTGEITGIVLGLYGLSTVYTSFGNGERGLLILGVIAFLTGVILVVKFYYGILNDFALVFTSVLFIGGAILLILFIENTKVKAFLYSGLAITVLSILSVFYFKTAGNPIYSAKAAELFGRYWPVILLLLGISLFVNRKK